MMQFHTKLYCYIVLLVSLPKRFFKNTSFTKQSKGKNTGGVSGEIVTTLTGVFFSQYKDFCFKYKQLQKRHLAVSANFENILFKKFVFQQSCIYEYLQELKISCQKIKTKIYFLKGFRLSFASITREEFSNGKNNGRNQYFKEEKILNHLRKKDKYAILKKKHADEVISSLF